MKKLVTYALAAASALAVAPPATLQAANHREAPITALDRTADITDVFAFVSYDPADATAADKVTFIMAVDPLLDPGNGPNYFPFDPDISYEIKVDNNNDAKEDLIFRFQFATEIRAPGVFTAAVGAGAGINTPADSPAPIAANTPLVPPAITSLDGAGSAGLNLRQTYKVSMFNRNRPGVRPFFRTTNLTRNVTPIAVPSNVGPRTMPSYPALFAQGIVDLGSGIKVFAGTVEDPFWIDLGATFDSINLRAGAFPSGIPGVMTDAQDATDAVSTAPDNVSGYNVNVIAIEVPIATLTRAGAKVASTDPAATIGIWATTSRPQVTVRRVVNRATPVSAPLVFNSPNAFTYRQVQRMANPLINELIIGTGSKDKFSVSQPSDDSQFQSFFLDPLLPRVLNAIYAPNLPIPTPPRVDLLPLVTYAPPIAAAGTTAGPVADLLRLNTGVPATPVGQQRRLGLLAHDAAGVATPDPCGWPNGRRPMDDVTDIALRAVAGALGTNTAYNGFPHNRLGDGVNVDDVQPYPTAFPYLSPALDGRNSRHVDPGENGLPTN